MKTLFPEKGILMSTIAEKWSKKGDSKACNEAYNRIRNKAFERGSCPGSNWDLISVLALKVFVMARPVGRSYPQGA